MEHYDDDEDGDGGGGRPFGTGRPGMSFYRWGMLWRPCLCTNSLPACATQNISQSDAEGGQR